MAATASRACEGYVVFVAGAVPGRPRARRGRQGQEGVRRGARRRDRRAVAGPRARGRRPSGRAVAGAAVRAPARGQGVAGRRGADADRAAVGLRAGADRARRRAVALPQQGRVLVRHGRRGRARVRLPRARAAGTRSSPMGDCKLVSAARERAARAGARVLQGLRRVGPARPARLPAQPRHPRGPPHRADAGPAGHLARQARRRRPDRRGRRRRPVVDPDRRPRREHLRRREHAAGGRAAARRPARRARLPDLARGVLPDQHRDGREALRRGAGVRRRCAGTSASSTCTRGSARSRCRWPPAPAR